LEKADPDIHPFEKEGRLHAGFLSFPLDATGLTTGVEVENLPARCSGLTGD
jgi:hypothetical protein